MIGLGLMFLALRQLLELMSVYEDTPSLRMLLGAVATQPLIDVILAAALTWAAHSSVAVVLFVMSLAARGAVPPDAAYALVLGANSARRSIRCSKGRPATIPPRGGCPSATC